ncbi:uncharacterized protein LOC123922901 [Trifolium pratense]|uniref:uncharacterized protein LOC123922901 n=1 Tax=Trifolium pratense TaxID=57577 RepID=UPI001E690CC9|nr:uncharacterized protein LOC123922901 [Trifolium pratense]
MSDVHNDYPEFRNLHHLKFILPCFNSNLLINVLEKCRILRVLIILSNKGGTNKYHSIKRLTNISKGSVKCQLKFDLDGSP